MEGGKRRERKKNISLALRWCQRIFLLVDPLCVRELASCDGARRWRSFCSFQWVMCRFPATTYCAASTPLEQERTSMWKGNEWTQEANTFRLRKTLLNNSTFLAQQNQNAHWNGMVSLSLGYEMSVAMLRSGMMLLNLGLLWRALAKEQ